MHSKFACDKINRVQKELGEAYHMELRHFLFEVTVAGDFARDPVEISIWYDCDRNGISLSLEGIQKYKNGRAALLDMLYGEVDFVTDAWRDSTLHMLEDIFPEANDLETAQNREKDLTPWQRFCLQQMTVGKQAQAIEYQTEIRLDRSKLNEIYTEALKKADNEVPSMNTYQETCDMVIQYDLNVPDKAYMVFHDPDSMCNWLLVQSIKTCRSIRRCLICKRFFFARRNQISCSTACKNIKNDLILFGNSRELAKKSNRLDAKFNSKANSVHIFKLRNLPDTQEPAELKELCHIANIQLDGLLCSRDFSKLSYVFHGEVKKRCDHLKEVKASVLRGEIPPAKESEAVREFETWITHIDEQMGHFSYSRRYMTPSEVREAELSAK